MKRGDNREDRKGMMEVMATEEEKNMLDNVIISAAVCKLIHVEYHPQIGQWPSTKWKFFFEWFSFDMMQMFFILQYISSDSGGTNMELHF